MDRHTLEQLRNQVDELLRHGSPSSIRAAHSVMVENFEIILNFALDLTEPKPKPKHTIADNYPAGGLTATEPCMFCKDFHKLEENYEKLIKIKQISYEAICTGDQEASDKAIGLIEDYEQALGKTAEKK